MGGSSRSLQLILQLKDQASKELQQFNERVRSSEAATNDWNSAITFAKRSLLALATASAGFLGYGIKVAADLQTAQIGLETLLGSADDARRTMARLKIEAARTPFELPGLTQATQLLTSVTKDGDKSIDILLDVGEALAAMGKGQAELDRIIVNLQQIAATGRAATIDIRQFAFAGIPIYEMLTETTGKSGEALEELITSGGVTFDLLTQMFDEANDAGGRFFNAFQNQSGSFNQAFSNMKDSLGVFAADFVTTTGLLDGLSRAMMTLSETIGATTVDEFLTMLEEKTGIVSLFRDSWVEVSNALIPLQPMLTELAKLIGASLVVALHALVFVIRETIVGWAAILTGAQKLSDFLVGGFLTAWDKIGAVIDGIVERVEKLVNAFQRAINLAREIGGGAVSSISRILPGRASGGVVSQSTPYMVGERGPELFVPNSSGNIVPNNRLGGSSIVVNINGGNYLSQDAAERIGDEIISRLKLSLRLV